MESLMAQTSLRPEEIILSFGCLLILTCAGAALWVWRRL